MLLTRQQLAMSLCELVDHDYELLNAILVEYCEKLSDKRFDDLEEYVNNNLNEILH